MNNIKPIQGLAKELVDINNVDQEEDIDKLVAYIRNAFMEMKQENEEFQALFDAQRNRTREADKMWQEATGKHHAIPDLGELIDWLIHRGNLNGGYILEKLDKILDRQEGNHKRISASMGTLQTTCNLIKTIQRTYD